MVQSSWGKPGLEVGKLAFERARLEVIREYQEIADSVEAAWKAKMADVNDMMQLDYMRKAYVGEHNRIMYQRKEALDALVRLRVALAKRVGENPPTIPVPSPTSGEGGERVPWQRGRAVADKMVENLRPYCEKIAVGGSVRRGAQTVKDVEIVVIPRGDELWKVLDGKVKEGTIQKAVYGQRNGKPIYRWGNKYRGFMWGGMKIEVFAATAENWGYIFLLRTGPGEANTAIMQACKVLHAPFQFRDGNVYQNGKLITVESEQDMFRLLGLEYVRPADRTAAGYWAAFKREGHEFGGKA